MSFSDSYRQRLYAYGDNESQAIRNSTYEIVNKNFSNSPNYVKVKINDTESDGRILDGDVYNEKKILLRPNSKVDIGSYIQIDDSVNDTWLVFDFEGELIAPKVTIKKCNEKLRWKDKDSKVHALDVLASATKNTKLDLTSDNFQVEMLQGGIYVYVPYSKETSEIRSSYRFIIGNSAFEVTGVDDLTMVNVERVGILQMSLRYTTIRNDDDLLNKIADNSRIYANDTGLQNSGGGNGDLW